MNQVNIIGKREMALKIVKYYFNGDLQMELVIGIIVLVAIAYGVFYYWTNKETPSATNAVAPYKVEPSPKTEVIEFVKPESKAKMAKPVKAKPAVQKPKSTKAKPVVEKAKQVKPAKAKTAAVSTGKKTKS